MFFCYCHAYQNDGYIIAEYKVTFTTDVVTNGLVLDSVLAMSDFNSVFSVFFFTV